MIYHIFIYHLLRCYFIPGIKRQNLTVQWRKETQKHIIGTMRNLAQHLVIPYAKSMFADLKVHKCSCDHWKLNLAGAKDSSSGNIEHEAGKLRRELNY